MSDSTVKNGRKKEIIYKLLIETENIVMNL